MSNQLHDVGDVIALWQRHHNPSTPGYASLMRLNDTCAAMQLRDADDTLDIMEELLRQRGDETPTVCIRDFKKAWDWCAAKGHLTKRKNPEVLLFKTVYEDWLATLKKVKKASVIVYRNRLRRQNQDYTLEQAANVPCPNDFPGSRQDANVWRRAMTYAASKGLVDWAPNHEPTPNRKRSKSKKPTTPIKTYTIKTSPLTLFLEPEVWRLLAEWTGEDMPSSKTETLIIRLIESDLAENSSPIKQEQIVRRKINTMKPRVTIIVPRTLIRNMRARRGTFTAADYITTLVHWEVRKPAVPAPIAGRDEPIEVLRLTHPNTGFTPASKARAKTQLGRLSSALNLQTRDVVNLAISRLYNDTFGISKES